MRGDERDEKYKSFESQKFAGIVDANLNDQERPKHKPAVKVNRKQANLCHREAPDLLTPYTWQPRFLEGSKTERLVESWFKKVYP